MFTLQTNRQFTTEVKVRIPADPKPEEHVFKARFRVLDDEALEAHRMTTTEGEKAFLRGVLVSFSEVQDAEGNELPFTDATKEALIGDVFARKAMIAAYVGGIAQAQMGNFAGPGARG